jgi:hypothetical protein
MVTGPFYALFDVTGKIPLGPVPLDGGRRAFIAGPMSKFTSIKGH